MCTRCSYALQRRPSTALTVSHRASKCPRYTIYDPNSANKTVYVLVPRQSASPSAAQNTILFVQQARHANPHRSLNRHHSDEQDAGIL